MHSVSMVVMGRRLRLIGDGSDGRHVCTKYRGHRLLCWRLFVVLGEHIAMAMVVVELNFIVIHNTMY